MVVLVDDEVEQILMALRMYEPSALKLCVIIFSFHSPLVDLLTNPVRPCDDEINF